jgi:hypothetical protein
MLDVQLLFDYRFDLRRPGRIRRPVGIHMQIGQPF